MAQTPSATGTAELRAPLPAIRRVGFPGLWHAIALGFDDFLSKPSHVLFLGILYPLAGLIIARLTFGYDILPVLYPLVTGFSLLGPLVAIGFYELSRRREAGLDASWWQAMNVVNSASIGSIVLLGLVLMLIFLGWLKAAATIYVSLFGEWSPPSFAALAERVISTPQGHELVVTGNAVGFLFALLVFSISAVSFPMMVDRKVGAATAAITSVRAVLANPAVMLTWAFIIAVALVIGSLPFFLGLAVVAPVLGHASWHLYRKVVVS